MLNHLETVSKSKKDEICEQNRQKEDKEKAKLERIRYTKRMSWRRKQLRIKQTLADLNAKHFQYSSKNKQLEKENKNLKLLIELMRGSKQKSHLSSEATNYPSSIPALLHASLAAPTRSNHEDNMKLLKAASTVQSNGLRNLLEQKMISSRNEVEEYNQKTKAEQRILRNASTEELIQRLKLQEQLRFIEQQYIGATFPTVAQSPFLRLPSTPAVDASIFMNQHSLLQGLTSSNPMYQALSWPQPTSDLPQNHILIEKALKNMQRSEVSEGNILQRVLRKNIESAQLSQPSTIPSDYIFY